MPTGVLTNATINQKAKHTQAGEGTKSNADGPDRVGEASLQQKDDRRLGGRGLLAL
jgi:hypothetical protein